MFVGNIQPGNKALTFIDRRLKDDNYRGETSSQHNRYDMAEIFDTLSLLNSFAPDLSLIRIRDTDLSKRPANTSSEIPYARFCEEVKLKVGKGTQDSIRKNIFVDLHRMGLIDRFSEDRNPVAPLDRGAIKYVALTSDGLEFISVSLLNRAFLFTKAIDKLLGGYVEVSLELLKDTTYDLKKLTKFEFMFFVSAVDTSGSFNVTRAECVELLRSWRLLSRTQQKAVIETLKQKLKPGLFTGDKTAKRDWHNWQNKIDQVYSLLRQSPYFDVSGYEHETLTLSTRKVVTKAGEILDLPKRSLAAKFDYFDNHKTTKTLGYELHHVVPLSWSGSAEQYKLFDTWLNMVYIDAFSHAKVTQNRNRNVSMHADGDGLKLCDFDDNEVQLKKDVNILYSIENQTKMLTYNQELRTTVSR